MIAHPMTYFNGEDPLQLRSLPVTTEGNALLNVTGPVAVYID